MPCRSRGTALLSAGLLLCGLFGPRVAAAQSTTEEPLEEVSFEYHEAPCGSQKAFINRVRKRTTKFKVSDPKSELRHFEITIQVRNAEHSAELRITSVEGETTTRTVSGETCEELFDAVALMTALAIDPTAPAVDPDAEKSDADATIVEDPEQADPPQEQDPSPTLTPEQSTTAPKEKKKKPPPAPPPRQGRRFWRLGSGGDFVITGGAVNKALVGGQFHLMSEWLLSEYFAPTLRLSGSYQESSAIDGPVGRALFQLYGGAIEVCPLRVAFGVPTIRPCLSTAVGGLRGKGVDVPDGVSEVKDYATVGMTGRFELPVHRLISLEAGFGAHFPLRRDRFVLANDVVSQAQVVTGKGSVGLLIWFF